MAISVACLCLTGIAYGNEVKVIGLTEGKAVLVIDGGKARTLRAGETSPEGIKLISADPHSAIVEISGKREALLLDNAVSYGSPGAINSAVTLAADSKGHYVTTGTINGVPVEFLVDTGATMVALSSSEARRLGINFSKAPRQVSNTANGPVLIYLIKLDRVGVGNVTLYNVDAVVHEGDRLPVVLLGMSFLSRVEIRQEGDSLVLRKRY